MDQPNSPVNTINIEMQGEFGALLDQIESNPAIQSVVLISKKATCFVAGADINMINSVSI
jgi:enoyl-CoA hydratase/carnithine racemase